MSVLSDAAASLGAGQWTELATLNLGTYIAPADQQVGRSILDYGPNFCWDPVDRWMLFYNSGGHSESPARIMRYTESTNAWDYYFTDSGGFHRYDCVAVVPADGHLWYWDIPNSGILREFIPGTGFVTRGGAGIPSYSYGGMDFFPEKDAFYGFREDGIRKQIRAAPYTRSDVDVRYPYRDGGVTYHMGAAYCPVAKYMFFYGNGTNITWRMDQNENVYTNSPVPGLSGLDMPSNSLTADPVTGDVLLLASDGGFRKMNPLTGTWTTGLSNPYGLTGSDEVSSMYVRCGPISTHGVVMYVKWDSGGNHRVYLYKHALQTVMPPSMPTNLRVVP